MKVIDGVVWFDSWDESGEDFLKIPVGKVFITPESNKAFYAVGRSVKGGGTELICQHCSKEDAIKIANVFLDDDVKWDAIALIRMIMSELPQKRDWLDPDVEKAAKALLGIS
jgi:hypothetical protein